MDPLSVIATVWWLGIPVALIMGALLTVNPGGWPVLGAALSLGSSGELGAPRGGLKLASAFGAGIVVVYAAVGLFASALDQVTEQVLRPYAGVGYLVLGGVLVVIATFLLVRPASFCAACARPSRRSPTVAVACLAGIPAGFVNCPACSGIILGVAASAAELGSGLYSAVIMAVLGTGHAAVLVGLSLLMTSGWSPSSTLLRGARKASALVLLLLASYFFYLAWTQGIIPGPRVV
ncbi:MAG: hypothetical protein ACRD1T_09100 [Acidimicrobiia bacterium]